MRIFREDGIRRTAMDVVKLGKKGQVSIPSAVLRQLGLEGDSYLIVETSEDGAIVLRPAAIYPIEIYSDERIKEFERENRIDPELEQRVKAFLARRA
jgi:AbrB family looped-hinge helix DNA binding protein